MKTRNHALIFLGLVCFAGAGALAQGPNDTVHYLTDKPGFWQPQRALGEHGTAITAAETAQIKANLEQIEAVLKKTEIGANPVGFYYTPAPMWVAKGAAQPILQGLGVYPLHFVEFKQHGAWVLDMHGETVGIEYNINHLEEIERTGNDVFSMVDKNYLAHPIFPKPEKSATIGGYPVYGKSLFLSRPGRELFVPVTVLEAMQAAMPRYKAGADLAESSLAEKKKAAKEFDADGYQKKELDNFEKNTGYNKTTDRKDYDEAKRQWMAPVLKHIKEVHDGGTPVRGDKDSDWYFKYVDAYANAQKRMAALSADEAKAPSCWAPNTSEASTSVIGGEIRRGPGGAACAPLVKMNPDYYDKKLPRTAVQLVTVTDVTRCAKFGKGVMVPTETKTSDGGCAVHAKMWQELNWQDLAALLVK